MKNERVKSFSIKTKIGVDMASQRWPQNIGKLTKLMKSGTSGLNFSTEIISFVIILLDTDYTLRNDAKTSDLKISYVEHSHQGWFENKVKCVFIRSLSLFLKVFFHFFRIFSSYRSSL